MMNKAICTAVALMAALAFAVESPFRVLQAPDPAANDGLKDFSLYCHVGHQAAIERAIVDGAPAFRLAINEAPAQSKNAQQIQLRLVLRSNMEAGVEYRIRFRCKSDRPAYMSFRTQLAQTPWSTPTEHAAGGVLLSPQWKYVEYCFTTFENDGGNTYWFPNFECGLMGKGNVLYLKDIVIEALD